MSEGAGVEPAVHRYVRRFTVAIASYCVLLVAALALGRVVVPPWRTLCALIVLPAVVAIVWAILRFWGEGDELARKEITESLAIGFAVGTPILLTVGLFQAFGLVEVSFIWAYAILMAAWLLGAYLVRRRYH